MPTSDPLSRTGPPPSAAVDEAALLACLTRGSAALALVDAGGQVLWSSDGFAQAVCGGTPADCRGKAVTTLLSTPWAGDFAGAAATPVRLDLRGQTWCLNAKPSGPGHWLLHLEPAADATDLRRQLADLRERLEVLQHFCQAGFFERDPVTREGRWDAHMFRIFGQEPPADAGVAHPAPPYEQIETLMLPEDRLPRGFVTTLDQPGEHAARLRLRLPDGRQRHLHSRWKVLHDDQGRPVRVVGVNIDDTSVFDLLRRTDELKEELELVSRLGDIGLWRHDIATDRLHFDERACRQLGLQAHPQGMPRAKARELIHPDDIPLLQASFDETLRTGLPTDMSIRYRRPGGGWLHMLSRRMLQRDEDGRPVAFVGVLLDESERIERTRAAQELSQRLEAAAEAAGIGLWSAEIDGPQLSWNRRMFDLLGLPPEQGPLGLGPLLRRCVHPADRDRVAAAVLDWARRGAQPVDIEFRVLRISDGALRWLVVRGDIDRQHAGGLRRLEGVAIDITEQREMTRQLHEAAERVALTASAVGLGSWQLDAQGQVGHWDDGMFRLRGLTSPARTVTAEEMIDRVHPEDRALVARSQASGPSGSDSWRYSFRVIWPDGSVRWLASRSTPVFYPDGSLRGRIGLNWDITETVLAEQAVRKSELALAESRAKSRFLSRVSHELRTPLNAVLGFTQLLRDERRSADPAVRRRWLDHVDGAGRHLLALIDDVLDLSRLDGGEMSLKLQPVALHELLVSAVPLIEGELREQGLTLQIEPGSVADVQADPLRLRQVVLNLLSNAVKYNRPGGSVRLHVIDDGPWVRLQVADTGPGIASDDLDAVFEPFHRGGAVGSGIEGTGIGLAIAKALVEQMGGTIAVSSQLGQGSVFSVTLPRASAATAPTVADASEPAANPAEAPPAPTLRKAPARVLYVEDNPINAMLLQELLADQSWITLELAVDGRSGLQQARDRPPDLLLLDLQLPDMPGLDVLRALRAEPATAAVRCVVLSANAMPRDIDAARAAGAIDYWTKPIDFPVMLCRLTQLLMPG